MGGGMKKFFGRLFLSLAISLSGCNIKDDFKNPEKQFIYIENHIEISLCHKSSDSCIVSNGGKTMASGVLVSHSKKTNKSYYLTAGHVCLDPALANPNQHKDFTTIVKSEFHLLDYTGQNNIAKVVAIDEKYDLCLLESKKVSLIPAIIEIKKIKPHIKVINVAAPAGLWSKETSLHFSGEFQGNYKGAHNEYKEEVAIYSIVAQKGSSGSPVYDPETGKLVGIITSVITPSYDIAIGPTLEQINNFIDENLPS
jgi:V8-like Glu-specific endopeptidase